MIDFKIQSTQQFTVIDKRGVFAYYNHSLEQPDSFAVYYTEMFYVLSFVDNSFITEYHTYNSSGKYATGFIFENFELKILGIQ